MPPPAAGLGVRDGREADQLVQRLEAVGRPPLDGVLDPLAEAEHRRADLVAHLDEVVERQLGDGVGVRLAPLGVRVQRRRPVLAGLGEAAVELDDVLEGAVHALAEERDDGVGGVAEERQPPAHPRPDADGDERPDRVAGELAARSANRSAASG